MIGVSSDLRCLRGRASGVSRIVSRRRRLLRLVGCLGLRIGLISLMEVCVDCIVVRLECWRSLTMVVC